MSQTLDTKHNCFQYYYFWQKLNGVIQRELKNFFDAISEDKLEFSDEFKRRDLIHLYDFQKLYLHRSMEYLVEFIKMNINHHWADHGHSVWEELSEGIKKNLRSQCHLIRRFCVFR